MRLMCMAVRTALLDVQLSLTGSTEILIPGNGLGGALDLHQIPGQGSNHVGRAASVRSREVTVVRRAASIDSREANA